MSSGLRNSHFVEGYYSLNESADESHLISRRGMTAYPRKPATAAPASAGRTRMTAYNRTSLSSPPPSSSSGNGVPQQLQPCEELDGPFFMYHESDPTVEEDDDGDDGDDDDDRRGETATANAMRSSASQGTFVVRSSSPSSESLSISSSSSSRNSLQFPCPTTNGHYLNHNQRDPMEDIPTSPQRRGLRISAEDDIVDDSRTEDPDAHIDDKVRHASALTASTAVVDDLDIYLMSSLRRQAQPMTDDDHVYYADDGNPITDETAENNIESSPSYGTNGPLSVTHRGTPKSLSPVCPTHMMMEEAGKLLGLSKSTLSRIVSSSSAYDVASSMTTTTTTASSLSSSSTAIVDDRSRSSMINSCTDGGSPNKKRRSRHSRSGVVLDGNSFTLIPNPQPIPTTIDKRRRCQASTYTFGGGNGAKTMTMMGDDDVILSALSLPQPQPPSAKLFPEAMQTTSDELDIDATEYLTQLFSSLSS